MHNKGKSAIQLNPIIYTEFSISSRIWRKRLLSKQTCWIIKGNDAGWLRMLSDQDSEINISQLSQHGRKTDEKEKAQV